MAPASAESNVDRALGIGLLALAVGLAGNSLAGPLALGVIRYRFSETLILQGIGLDAVSLLLVAPACVAVGVAALRGARQAAILAVAPAAYAAYMAVQYVVGPQYLELAGNNERFFALHLGLFALGVAAAVLAWTAAGPADLPEMSERAEGRWSLVLLALAALLVLRYLPGILDLATGTPSVAEYRENPTTYFLIAVMDLGVVAPAAAAAGLGLRRHREWARKAMYAVMGWFGLVGPAVAAMSVTMWLEGDPAASAGQAAAFVAVGGGLLGLALWLYRPLVRDRV